jgi:hypothetical protein
LPPLASLAAHHKPANELRNVNPSKKHRKIKKLARFTHYYRQMARPNHFKDQ